MIHEHHLTVARTARYYTVGEPGPAVASSGWPVTDMASWLPSSLPDSPRSHPLIA